MPVVPDESILYEYMECKNCRLINENKSFLSILLSLS